MQSRAPRLLEREGDLAQLGRLIAAARSGAGAAVAVVGPAGIGKSSLLAAARGLAAERGLDVLAARGGELEADYAYGVVRNLLEPALLGLADDERDAVLDGAARPAAPLVAGAAGAGADSPFAVVHALYWVCGNLCRTAAAADRRRRPALGRRRVAALPRIPGTPRRRAPAARAHRRAPGERARASGPGHRAHRGARGARVAARAVERRRRSRSSRAALGRGAPPALARAAWQATGGNPFLRETLAAALAALGPGTDPETLVESAAAAASSPIVARIGQLPAEARSLAGALAILGGDAELRDAAALAGLAEHDAVAADVLVAQGILAAGRPLDFVHPLVRAAVREGMPEAERRLAHANAARVVGAAGRRPDAVAAHLLAADAASDPWVTLRADPRGHSADRARRAARPPPRTCGERCASRPRRTTCRASCVSWAGPSCCSATPPALPRTSTQR